MIGRDITVDDIVHAVANGLPRHIAERAAHGMASHELEELRLRLDALQGPCLRIPEGPGRWVRDEDMEKLLDLHTAELRLMADRVKAADRDLKAFRSLLGGLSPDTDPRHVAPMLRLLGPARMVLDRCAEEDSPQARAEAADMAQRLTDWIGHPVTDEPPWALLPCEHPNILTTAERAPDNPVRVVPCRSCRPCMARVVAGYEAGLVDGAPVVEGMPG